MGVTPARPPPKDVTAGGEEVEGVCMEEWQGVAVACMRWAEVMGDEPCQNSG